MNKLRVDSFADELPKLEAEVTFENALERVEASVPTNHATANLTATALENAGSLDNVIDFPCGRLTEAALASVGAVNAPTPKAAPLAAQAI
jgi:hypothetical protein